MLFIEVYRAFLSVKCTEEAVTERVEQVVATNAEKFKAEHGVGMWAHEVEQMRALARERVEAHDEQFDHYHRQFFFVDLFPENNQRFPVTIETCRKSVGHRAADGAAESSAPRL